MSDYSNYMGGTNISLEGLKKYYPTTDIDGTQMNIEDWFKEIELFESLIPNESKVFVGYTRVLKHGIFKSIDWQKFELKNYSCANEENEDWWFFKPELVVEVDGNEWIVREYSFYEENTELVHINKIEPQTVEVFTAKGRSMGFVNEYEFNDLRVQIATHKIMGYFVKYNDKRYYINKDGSLSFWTSGLFDLMENQYAELFKTRV